MKKNRRFAHLKQNKGLTLVEVIISVMLFGIISLLMTTVLLTGTTLALKSGDNTKVVGNASGVLENVLGGAEIALDGEEIKVVEEDGTEVTVGTGAYTENTAEAGIVFHGGATDIIDGTFHTVDSDSERNETSMKVFVPE